MSLPVTLESYRVEALDLRGNQSVIRDSYEGRAASRRADESVLASNGTYV